MNNTFCPIPWLMLATRTNGDVRVCCQANQGKTHGLLTDNHGRPYNLKRNTILDSRNAPLACEMRKKMIEGERHPECLRCWREEDSGMLSRREQEIELWQEVFGLNEARKITGKRGEIPADFEPIYYDLRLGNLCNLKCRMCFPTDSSGWYSEYNDIYEDDYFYDTHGKVQLVKRSNGWQAKNNDYDWCLRENFWQDLESKIGNIRHIYIVGGEPLLIRRHYEFLEKCIALGYAKNIKLEYNTNITTISDEILKLWASFKEVRIGASVDGYGKIDEYIRYPSKWETIERNLQKIDKMEGNVLAWIACTVMIYNVYYIPDFIKWKLESNFKRINPITRPKPFLTLHPLHTPPYFNIKALPLNAKKAVANKYRDFYDWYDEYISHQTVENKELLRKKLRHTLDGYINYMNKADWTRELNRFWEVTRRLDESRNQNIEEFLPELYRLIGKSEKNG